MAEDRFGAGEDLALLLAPFDNLLPRPDMMIFPGLVERNSQEYQSKNSF